MGTSERSERAAALRESVMQALAKARERHEGRLSRFLVTVEPDAIRAGLTKDDFYRAARPDLADQLSLSKLSRLQEILERAGVVEPTAEQGSELQRAILALSRITRTPERFRRTLPRRMFCLRRSYLVPRTVNVSFVEISAEDLTVRYQETRAGSLGAASQRAVLTGTVLHHDDLDDLYYVIGLNEFRTNFAVEEATSVHANLVALTILRQCERESFEAFEGIHLGVMPDNNPDHPSAPYAAKLLLVETEQSLPEAAHRGLIQNHAEDGLMTLAGWLPAERQRLARHLVPGCLSNDPDPAYDLLVADVTSGNPTPLD
ncbi:MAG: hypothetical protein GC151_00810 [Betaproteobacteria bacterium]|nr:hypothetical protein [Betaproteobacteria bacterium]